jgi:chromosome segregation ATPase
MTDETRIHISIKIPERLHDLILLKVTEGKYKDKTACVTVALENELCNTHQEALCNTEASHDRVTETQKSEVVLQGKHAEIEKLKAELSKASDPTELAQLRARFEELEKHNETLKKELDKAERDKEDLKENHKNYFLQVQTLINQKAIEAPGAKKPWYRFW